MPQAEFVALLFVFFVCLKTKNLLPKTAVNTAVATVLFACVCVNMHLLMCQNPSGEPSKLLISNSCHGHSRGSKPN